MDVVVETVVGAADVFRLLEHRQDTDASRQRVVPGFFDRRLPIGLQIVGQRFDDVGVLRLCRAFEDLRGPQRPWPIP